ncbi:MAG: cation:dicarboxylase symporter family transporter [Oceanicoccus sp.]
MKFSKIPLSARILGAMFVGIIIGAYTSTVFPGVDAAANAFIMSLQMTALPYISLSLIVGVGGLSIDKIGSTVRQAMLILILLMIIVLLFILLAPISFPDWETAEFYSANVLNLSDDFDLVSLFIPANPFHAFANTLIPSVVFFSLLVGIGLMTVRGKKHTLLVLGSLQASVANVSSFVMRFAPIGVFCIGLRAAATIDSSQVHGLSVYLVTASVVVILLAFIVFPALVATFTPFGYRQIMKASRESMITGFATGSFFVVIPIIVEKTKHLISELDKTNQDAQKLPGIIVPISFSLPIGGKLLALLFTLFAAWFSGAHTGFSDYVKLVGAGLPQLFGSSTIAMPNLLDLFNVSGSMFDLFIVSENLLVGRLGALLSVVFATSLTLLIATSMVGKFTIKWRSFARYLAIIPILSVLSFIALRYTFSEMTHQYEGYTAFIDRDFILEDVDSRHLNEPPASAFSSQPSGDVLTRVRQRGFIRAGYFRDDLPYSFHNSDGKLVGFDIEIINLLANDLDVTIEFVRIFRNQAKELLASGYLDITTGVPLIPDNMEQLTLTIPYSQQSMAILTKDERRAEFKHWETIVNRDDLIIGIPESFFYEDAVTQYFTQGKAWKISTPRLFFREDYQHIDAMLFGAPAASAWTLLYPDYTVIVPKPVASPLSMAFPISKNDHIFELFMRNWITMKRESKALDKLFNFWIGGKKINESLLLTEFNQQ